MIAMTETGEECGLMLQLASGGCESISELIRFDGFCSDAIISPLVFGFLVDEVVLPDLLI